MDLPSPDQAPALQDPITPRFHQGTKMPPGANLSQEMTQSALVTSNDARPSKFRKHSEYASLPENSSDRRHNIAIHTNHLTPWNQASLPTTSTYRWQDMAIHTNPPMPWTQASLHTNSPDRRHERTIPTNPPIPWTQASLHTNSPDRWHERSIPTNPPIPWTQASLYTNSPDRRHESTIHTSQPAPWTQASLHTNSPDRRHERTIHTNQPAPWTQASLHTNSPDRRHRGTIHTNQPTPWNQASLHTNSPDRRHERTIHTNQPTPWTQASLHTNSPDIIHDIAIKTNQPTPWNQASIPTDSADRIHDIAIKTDQPEPNIQAIVTHSGSTPPPKNRLMKPSLPQSNPIRSDSKKPTLQHISAPTPTAGYLKNAHRYPTQIIIPQRLLLVLDLNGTLLDRSTASSRYLPRPFLNPFLAYCLANHTVLIWSSASPQNVSAICAKLFQPRDRRTLLGEWARDTLGLTPEQYVSKVQVYKRLDQIWHDPHLSATHPLAREGQRWSQENTLLIDDSPMKASAQPYNLLQIPEFIKNTAEIDVLGQVVGYIEEARRRDNVSAYVRSRKFEVDGGWTWVWGKPATDEEKGEGKERTIRCRKWP